MVRESGGRADMRDFAVLGDEGGVLDRGAATGYQEGGVDAERMVCVADGIGRGCGIGRGWRGIWWEWELHFGKRFAFYD